MHSSLGIPYLANMGWGKAAKYVNIESYEDGHSCCTERAVRFSREPQSPHGFLNPLFMSSIHAVAAGSGIMDGAKSATLTHSTCRGQAT